MIVEFYLEEDDHTYIYGGRLFKAEFDPETKQMLEPYVRRASPTKTIKFYPSKKVFIVYMNNKITELIFVMTCWSDEYTAYMIHDNKAISYTECYHGFPKITPTPCDVDFTDYIRDNGLEMDG